MSPLQGRLAGRAAAHLAVLPALPAAPGRQLHRRAARPPRPASARHAGAPQGEGVLLASPRDEGNPAAALGAVPWGLRGCEIPHGSEGLCGLG